MNTSVSGHTAPRAIPRKRTGGGRGKQKNGQTPVDIFDLKRHDRRFLDVLREIIVTAQKLKRDLYTPATTPPISLPKLASFADISERQAHRSADRLEVLGCIARIKHVRSRKAFGTLGIMYRVNATFTDTIPPYRIEEELAAKRTKAILEFLNSIHSTVPATEHQPAATRALGLKRQSSN